MPGVTLSICAMSFPLRQIATRAVAMLSHEATTSSLYDRILRLTRSRKRTKDVVSRRVFESPNAFSGRARWVSFSAPPDHSRHPGMGSTY